MDLKKQQRQEVLQPDNPTDQQRYALLKDILRQGNRLEDFPYIINGLKPAKDITTIAPPGKFKGVKVGILGGGLAGLSAAYELRKLGFDITLFEALEDRIGGLVYTYYFNEDKTLYGELGPMRIPVGHETTWHYINLFGLNTHPFIQSNPNTFIYIRDTRVRNDPNGESVTKYIYPQFNLTPKEKNTPWQQLIKYGLNTPLFTMTPKERGEILETRSKYNNKLTFWSALNNRQVMEKMRLSRNAIDLIGSIDPIVGSFLYNSYSEVMQENYTADFGYVYEINGGLQNLPLALYHALISSECPSYYPIDKRELGPVNYKRGHIVEGIYYAKDDKVAIKYHEKATETSSYQVFDYVVCALPFSTVRTLDIHPVFENKKMEAIREVSYEDIQKTLLLCKKRFWEEGGQKKRIVGGGSVTDLPIANIWYPSKPGKTPNEPGVLLASYNLGLDAIRIGNMDKRRRDELIKRNVEAVHGLPKGYLDDIVMDIVTQNWGTDQWFLGICFYMPQQKSLFAYPMNLPEYNERLFFAGVHVAPIHGWMQGALQSGMYAANHVAKVCRDRLLHRN